MTYAGASRLILTIFVWERSVIVGLNLKLFFFLILIAKSNSVILSGIKLFCVHVFWLNFIWCVNYVRLAPNFDICLLTMVVAIPPRESGFPCSVCVFGGYSRRENVVPKPFRCV